MLVVIVVVGGVGMVGNDVVVVVNVCVLLWSLLCIALFVVRGVLIVCVLLSV